MQSNNAQNVDAATGKKKRRQRYHRLGRAEDDDDDEILVDSAIGGGGAAAGVYERVNEQLSSPSAAAAASVLAAEEYHGISISNSKSFEGKSSKATGGNDNVIDLEHHRPCGGGGGDNGGEGHEEERSLVSYDTHGNRRYRDSWNKPRNDTNTTAAESELTDMGCMGLPSISDSSSHNNSKTRLSPPPLGLSESAEAQHRGGATDNDDDQQNINNNNHSKDDGDDDDSFDLDSDWEEEEEAGLRRYHINEIPLPAEFTHTRSTMVRRLWQSFLELRAQARQRRAARLLTMPSESDIFYQSYACFLTWCCDATDHGIFFAAVCLLLWIIIGWVVPANSLPTWWWSMGFFLFVARVTARRMVEAINRKRRRRRSSVRNPRSYGIRQQKQNHYYPTSTTGTDNSMHLHNHHAAIETMELGRPEIWQHAITPERPSSSNNMMS